MKQTGIFILLLAIYFNVAAQNSDCKTVYFKRSKQISTTECYTASRFGTSKAFNRAGKVIYEKNVRKIAGHASVWYSYYPSGAVSKAEYSDAPDAGIQWYNSTTSFDTAGNVTNFWQQSHDDIHTLVAPPLPKKPDTAPKKEIAKCAEIYVSEGWFINGTKDTVRVNADRIGNIKEHFSELIAPGETKKVLYFILAQQFDDPEKYYSISLVPGKRKKKKLRYELLNKANANPTTKKYVYLVQ